MRWLILLLLPSLAWSDGLSLGAGKLLNNANRDHAGWVADATYSHGPVQLSFSKVNDTFMGAEMVATAMYRLGHGRSTFALGPIVSYSVEVPAWWWIDGHNGSNEAFNRHANCTFCGFSLQAAYAITPKLEFQLRYWGTEKMMIPSHNGALAVLAYRLQ